MLDKETEEAQATAPRTLKTIVVYGYHPDTLEPLRCAITADESPLEEDVYLLPQYTTRTKPLANKDGYTQKYEHSSDTWQYLRTWRSVPLYHTGTGLPYHIGYEGWDGLGELPDMLTDLPPPNSAHDWDAKKQAWVLNKTRQAELEAQAQAQAVADAVAGVTDALSAAIAAEFATLNGLIGANFKSQDTFMTYAGFPNAFQSPAQAFGAWTSSVWSEANEYKKQVFAGKKPMLSPVEAVALMPAFDMSAFE